MNRKRFIESNGATCKNWQWSWSFINMETKEIIFGEWYHTSNGRTALILNHEWKTNNSGRINPGYDQAIEHLKMIENDGFGLKTFTMYQSDILKDSNGIGPARIEKFDPILKDKKLLKIEKNYYSADLSYELRESQEVNEDLKYKEGAVKKVSVNVYERDPKARQKCLEFFGYSCQVCNVNFERMYGEIGKQYIHVHHLIPIHSIGEYYKIDPIKELVPVCPNCHAMIHTRKDDPIPIKEMKSILLENNN